MKMKHWNTSKTRLNDDCLSKNGSTSLEANPWEGFPKLSPVEKYPAGI